MANTQSTKIVRQLRRAVLLRDGAGMTDGQLLDCFLRQRDDAAFAALVRRHAPMVWGVCRRVLRHHHDAEDAFQATFLVLVRKAATVNPREMVANWLYGVAYQTALKARSLAARRKQREGQMAGMPEPAVEGHDLQPLLDRELSRLPDKYRVPIVLCDLEGNTRKEAARQLGWPEGTVAGRLAAGRKVLARRLARRGVALPVGTLAGVLAHNAASGAVPPSVVSSTIKAATTLAAGQGAAAGLISIRVAALTEGVLTSIRLNKLRTVAAVLVVLVLAGYGGSELTRSAWATDWPGATPKGEERTQKHGEIGKPTVKVYALIQEVDTERNTVTVMVAKDRADEFDSLAVLIEDFFNRKGTTITNLPITRDALSKAKDARIKTRFAIEREGIDVNELCDKVVQLQLAVDHRGLVVVGMETASKGKGSNPGK
jgi:RNA polymerase sigma factor (sigma-70 family)